MKICTIVGARPQFIKAAMVSKAIREHNSVCHPERSEGSQGNHGILRLSPQNDKPKAKNPLKEVLVHTGQHYDYKMSQVFFDQLDLPVPDYHLEVGSGTHGDQTGRMLAAIEKVLIDEKPDAVLVYGDTNSTLAGALAASKLHIPVGHVEGGMRSFNRKMPEEINRVLTDHIAKWHFCATETAVNNLKKEGITEGVHLVGDVMYDAIMLYKDIAREKSTILQRLNLLSDQRTEIRDQQKDVIPRYASNPVKADDIACVAGLSRLAGKYALATIHRPENTDDPKRLRNILEALTEISKDMPIVLPLHPRTRKAIESLSPFTFDLSPAVKIIEPVSYLDMLQLEQNASIILTDSGGMQKETFWLGVPCITMRDETEWIETVEAGYNKVVGANKEAIMIGVRDSLLSAAHNSAVVLNSTQRASNRILSCLIDHDLNVRS